MTDKLIKLVEQWINRADNDLKTVEILLKADEVLYDAICFHCQQSVEKYLKAYIVAYDLDFEKIHDLPVLLKTCVQQDPNLREILEECKFLNRYYIEARYPVHWPTSYDKVEAQKAGLAAERIREKIRTSLKSLFTSNP